MIVNLSDDAENDLLVAIAFYEKHGTGVGSLFFSIDHRGSKVARKLRRNSLAEIRISLYER